VQSLIWDSFLAATSTSPISSVILILINDISNSCFSSGIMLESTVSQNPSQQSVYSPSSRHPKPPSAGVVAAASSSSQLESGSSRSTSTSTPASFSDTTNTPTSFAAPLSTSAAAAARDSARPSAHLPQRHDVPPYISRQSHDSSTASSPSAQQASTTATRYPSSSPSTNTTAAAGPRPSTSSMNPASSVTSSASSAAFSHGPPTTYPSSNINNTPTSRSGSYSSPASSRLQPTSRPLRSYMGSETSSPNRIRVRDLSHVQSFAYEEYHTQSQRNSRASGQWEQKRQYEISSMPVTDIIEMVAGLLTKITTTNDVHHEQMHRRLPSPDGTTNLSPQATSVLAFHGKNVPGISILSYLTRIHKYCPTTYEVFLSLLVYFDRMTEMVNKGHLDRVRHRWGDYSGTEAENNNVANPHNTVSSSEAEPGTRTTQPMHTSPIVTPPSSTGMVAQDPTSPSSISPSLRPQGAGDPFSHSFVVDSFNIHRLVIAGVTCASKFFSDVFYTNSRYAKVLLSPVYLIQSLICLGRRSPLGGIEPSRTAISIVE